LSRARLSSCNLSIIVKNKYRLSPYLIVFISFITLIFIGAFLFSLPISHKDGSWGEFVPSLFLSTSAVTVTGLTPYPSLINELTRFGQIVLLFLIAIGGLGLITIFTFLVTLSTHKIGIFNRYVIKEALNLSSMRGAIRFVRKIIFITLIIEAIFIIPFLIVFIPKFGWGEGIFQSIFMVVSTFNNAGFDLFGDSSVQIFNNNILINITMILLIIAGGLGFLVWTDILSKKKIRNWSAYTKIVLIMTIILTFLGTVGLLFSEFGKSSQLNIMEAMFHSVSSRTAGFTTVEMNDISIAGRLFLMLMMFIGANPISTGGGIKTTTAFIIFIAIYSFIRGKKVHAFKRSFSNSLIIKAMSLTFISGLFIFICIIAIDRIESFNPLFNNSVYDSSAFMFEAFSAFGTVGFSQGITANLTNASKIILSMLMLLGRIGPMTMIAIFSEKMNKVDYGNFEYIEATVPIG
jgi:trk system potassium uptake protein